MSDMDDWKTNAKVSRETKREAMKVDPSVSRDDLALKGEPEGSVPMATTMRKPEAYYKGEKE